VIASSGETPFAIGKQLYRVVDAMDILSLSRSSIYELIRSGRLRTVKEGRTRLIPATAIADYVALLEREADRQAA
jgi:excisionase family DNA binding protein